MDRRTVPPLRGIEHLGTPRDRPTWAMSHPGSLGIVVLGALVLVCAGVRFAAPVLVPMVLGGYVASVSMPLVAALRRRRVPASLAITAAVFIDAAILVGLIALLASSVGELSARLPRYEGLLQHAEWRAGGWLRRLAPGMTLPDVIDPTAVVGFVASVLGDLAGFLWNVVVALIIAAFLLGQMTAAKTGGEASPLSQEWRRAILEVNRYVAIKTATSLATGLLIGLWTWASGAEFPVLYGLLAFLLNYIPNFGSIIAAAPAIGLALLGNGVGAAVVVGSGYLIINMVIGNVVEPRVMGRVLGLTPLVVLLSVIFWGWLLGVVGALLSALLSLLVKLVLLSTEDLRPFAIAMGPRPVKPPIVEDGSADDLLEETMPKTIPVPSHRTSEASEASEASARRERGERGERGPTDEG